MLNKILSFFGVTRLMDTAKVKEDLETLLSGCAIDFISEKAYLNGSRYLMAHSKNSQTGIEGFIKISNNKILVENLKKEVGSITMANLIGVPTTKFFQKVTHLNSNIYYYHREWLPESTNRVFITDLATLKGFEEVHLQIASKIIGKYAGLEVTQSQISDTFIYCDIKKHWASCYSQMWKGNKNKGETGLEGKMKRVLATLDKNLAEQIKQVAYPILEEFREKFKDEISTIGNSYYFVHNDCTPRNFYYKLDKGTAIYIDLEFSCLTQYKIMAMNNDIANFYGRLTAKPNLQRKFLELIYNEIDLPEEKKKLFLKHIVTVGSLSLPKVVTKGKVDTKDRKLDLMLIDAYIPNINFIDLL